ncbi:MAG TPA: glucose-6-phosphate dehydrogenase assembly protein OpcA [Frankiaceae bacterium]|nr:glucose-6-phosphate dehydrogenase assembly protein OpcA [Frankiaceae bacterium]
MTELTGSTASEVAALIARERRRSGTGMLGMVLTLVVATDERGHYDALRAANDAAMEHPCRVIAVIPRAPKEKPRLDAEVGTAQRGNPGENVVLRLYGHLGEHADSVVLPLLLPDAPVVVWWPGDAPKDPGASPLGRLAHRRVTDAAACARPGASLRERLGELTDGDTDLAWTRLTPWRALLAAALDEPFDTVTGATIAAARGNPSAVLLAGWLRAKLGVEPAAKVSRGPGITEVRLSSARGDLSLARPDGERATLTRPGQPDRRVALKRRTTADLLAEELRRLDADEVYAESLAAAFPEKVPG